VAVLETGLVCNFEDNQEMETDLEGKHAGEYGPLLSAHLWYPSGTGSPFLAMILAPQTLAISLAPRPGAPSTSTATNTQDTPRWLRSWAQFPHQKEALRPVDVTKAKLHQICGFQ
jgi:hypothetical protein